MPVRRPSLKSMSWSELWLEARYGLTQGRRDGAMREYKERMKEEEAKKELELMAVQLEMFPPDDAS